VRDWLGHHLRRRGPLWLPCFSQVAEWSGTRASMAIPGFPPAGTPLTEAASPISFDLLQGATGAVGVGQGGTTNQGSRRGACLAVVLALLALLTQAALPLIHGPHGHRHSNTLLSAVAGPAHRNANGSLSPDDGDDCAQCPVCQAMHGASQPIVPVASGAGGCTIVPVAWASSVPCARTPDGRSLTDAPARGPPAAAC
jgi:hypothetical protein